MITLIIKMPIFSKARPRVTRHGTFMPVEYQRKRKEMLRQVLEQYQGEPLSGPVRIEVDVYGEGRADADNIIGAFLDAVVGYLIVDDRVNIVPQIQVSWFKATKADSRWVVRISDVNQPPNCQSSY